MKLKSFSFSELPTWHIIVPSAIAFLLALLLAVVLYAKEKEAPLPETPAAAFPPELSLSPESVTAKAAIVYDPRDGRILFAKNAHVSLPLASLTKLMTAQTVLALEQENPAVTISDRDLIPEGDWGFIPGTTWRLRDLLVFGLVSSSNDAMAAAAGATSDRFINEMNRTASSLGLYDTYFLNPTGLDMDPETAGAYGSAYDVARLAMALLEEDPALFEATAKPSITITSDVMSLQAASTDIPLLTIPGLIAAKTGYTDLAGGNLVAIFDVEVGRPLAVAVLGSTREARFSDVRKLIEAARLSIHTERESNL